MNGLISTSSRSLRSPSLTVACRSFSSGNDVGREDIKNLAPFFSSTPAAGNEALKRGTGGRSSFNGTVATVFGHGQLGSTVVNRLGRVGTQVIVPYRSDPIMVRRLKLAGDLGQILFLPFFLKDDESIYRAVKHSNVVINTIGQEVNTTTFDLEDVHVDGARRIARICREAGVRRFIHVSALNCHPNPQPIITRKGSEFYRTKYFGEVAVKEEFPTATIFRPSEMFGPRDRYLNYYGHWYRRSNRKICIWKKGKGVFKCPVQCSDVGEGIFNAIFDDSAIGQTYDAIGPRRYELYDIINFINQCIQKDEFHDMGKVVDMRLHPTFWFRVYLTEQLKKYPMLSWEKMECDHTTDRPTGNPTLEDLGVKPVPLEDRAMVSLDNYKRFGWLDESPGEKPVIPPIKQYPFEMA